MIYDCLIIDDEAALSQSTLEYFELFGVKTAWVPDASACFDFFKENTTGMILLDINLGDDSGFALCKKLREKYDLPILFISARTSDDDILLALGIGGDDYIAKPYALSILLAKVKAVLKRYRGTENNTFNFGRFCIDFVRDRITEDGEDLRLKTMEYKLLIYLVQNRNRVVGKEELFRNVWNDAITGDNTLNVHVRRLREKIEEDPNAPRFIKTVWGTGYCFEENGL